MKSDLFFVRQDAAMIHSSSKCIGLRTIVITVYYSEYMYPYFKQNIHRLRMPSETDAQSGTV